jgi:hypothetical protein
VLIERTAHEIKTNDFDWAFWIKLVIVAIGFTGGVVFMYIQCKMYFHLCLKWRQYNRVILIQPITEEILKNSKKLNNYNFLLPTANKQANNNNNNNNNANSGDSNKNNSHKINEDLSSDVVVLNLTTNNYEDQQRTN